MLDPKTQADIYYKEFDAALEEEDWHAALESLQQAAYLDPTRFSGFHPEEYELKQVLGASERDVQLLCRHLASNSQLVIKALRPTNQPVASYAGPAANDAEDVLSEEPARAASELDEIDDLDDEEEFVDEEDADYEESDNLELADFYCSRGHDHRLAGDLDLALADFTEAIRLDPESAEAYHSRGNVHFAARAYDRAIADYNEALRLDDGLAMAYLNRGLANARQRRFRDAAGDANQALRLDPTLTAAYVLRGGSHFRLGEFGRSVEDFTEALRLDPHDAAAYNHRGLAYTRLGDYDRAIDDFDQSLRLAPDQATTHFNRASTYQHKGDAIRAISEFTVVVQLDPHNAQGYFQRGLAYIAQGEYEPAIADFTDAYRLDPENALALFKRDEAIRARNDLAKRTPSPRREPAASSSKAKKSKAPSGLTCPACGKKINPAIERGSGRLRCPHCKAVFGDAKPTPSPAKIVEDQPKKRLRLRLRPLVPWLLLSGIFGLITTAGIFYWNSRPKPPAQITAFDLWWDCARHKAISLRKYDGKILQVSGVVNAVRTGDAPRVVFREPFAAPPPVECFLDQSGSPSAIQVNQWLTVVGKCQCPSNWEQPVQLLSCRVIPTQ
jgi:tetratricopeptide (TPR) repeat protein